MTIEHQLIKRFGDNGYRLADLPEKISGVTISRIKNGEEMGCSWCFPHGWETTNSRWSKQQRCWKQQRKTQWKKKK